MIIDNQTREQLNKEFEIVSNAINIASMNIKGDMEYDTEKESYSGKYYWADESDYEITITIEKKKRVPDLPPVCVDQE